MKKSFYVSRKVIVDSGDQYKPVTYNHGMGIEYTDEEVENNTIIESEEFKNLGIMVDQAQRKQIMEEMGIDKLIIDEVKASRKISPLKQKLLERRKLNGK